jgi:hypothetical protein
MKNKLIISIILIVLTLSACTVDTGSHINTAPAALAAPVPPQVMTVCNSYGLNVRECGGLECAVVDWLQDGDAVVIRTRSDGWAEVEQGWVSERYLCKVEGR